eukprot:m.100020 g.100020  ORF g.100020 m.100020 type:complete len:286 (+) comp16772_c0_seq2:300-1157(+)
MRMAASSSQQWEYGQENLPSNSNRVAAVIFDKDGTLLDDSQSNRLWAEGVARHACSTVSELCREKGIPEPDVSLLTAEIYSDIQYNAATGKPVASGVLASRPWGEIYLAVAQVAQRHLPADLTGAIDSHRVQQWTESLDIHAHQPPLCDLSRLQADMEDLGLACAICTADSRRALEAQVAQHALTGLGGVTVAACDGLWPKPDVRVGRHLTQALNVGADDTVCVVGDSLADLELAHNINGVAIAVLSDPAKRDILMPRAHVMVKSVAQVPAVLRWLRQHPPSTVQ